MSGVVFNLLFSFLLYSITQFSLWNISQYLSQAPLHAYLLFPTGLRLAAYLLVKPNYIWVLLVGDWLYGRTCQQRRTQYCC